MNKSVMRVTSAVLMASTLAFTVPMPAANAAMIATDQVTAAANEAQRDRIKTFLDRDEVRAELQRHGVNAEEAKARVDAMTDGEVERVAGRLDQLPAGGDIIGVLLTIFIVLLITDILGFTKVFSFTRPVR